MSGLMRPVPFKDLLVRSLGEYRKYRSIFDLPEEHFWTPAAGEPASLFGSTAENPVGPAAGPHTQLCQNILAAWLAGARYVELKTVQKLDALEIEKPCIDAADEGYNVEWSTELSLDDAYDEYLKAWCALHFFDALRGAARPGRGFLFNMSVGYDLEGIRTEKMNRFIDRLIDSSGETLFARYLGEIAELAADPSLLEGTPWKEAGAALRTLPGRISPRICGSVTLSTMHGCPPREIESICAYLLEEKGLDTLVKLNPTLLGYDRAKEMLARLGFGYVGMDPAGFSKDLRYTDAVPMLGRLLERARKAGRHFGVKLSNTLASANTRGILPGSEMYMSGRALYPLTMELAARLAADFSGRLPMSFSGGVSAWNIAEVLEAGIRPVTLATDLLKPGGYGRLKQMAEIAESRRAAWGLPAVDPEKARAAADSALSEPFYRKEWRGTGKVRVEGALPLFDCFVAPCVKACPIGQDVPEYVHLAGAGLHGEAFAVIYDRNPLPFVTGYLCDHQCTENCTRRDWEGAVRIRETKRIAAENGYAAFRAAGTPRSRRARGIKAAIVGAGPAGLAAAAFLAREGFDTHVFEREKEPGGVVQNLLPGFRLPADAVAKDVSLLVDLGVELHTGLTRTPTVSELRESGCRYVLVAIGAEQDRGIGIGGARESLAFLREFRKDPAGFRPGRSVVVVGAGDTAMDAARAAVRCPGVEDVRIVYRRSEREMPASDEEYRSAREEGIQFHFLRAPEKWDGRMLDCRIMELGAPDETGRSRPVPTPATETFPADAVVTAAGTQVRAEALETLGLGSGRNSFDPETQETALEGVFLLGDAAGGSATIVKAIASARRAVDAICFREGGSRYAPMALPAEDAAALRRGRDRLRPASRQDTGDAATAAVESARCLGCRALCLKCVEVCPNRANTVVRVADGFRDAAQIVHIDGFCNECGNCATFCPWDGRPYRDKLTIFDREEDFLGSENPGFFLHGARGKLRAGGAVGDLSWDAAGGVSAAVGDAAVRAVIEAILRDHSYLRGGST